MSQATKRPRGRSLAIAMSAVLLGVSLGAASSWIGPSSESARPSDQHHLQTDWIGRLEDVAQVMESSRLPLLDLSVADVRYPPLDEATLDGVELDLEVLGTRWSPGVGSAPPADTRVVAVLDGVPRSVVAALAGVPVPSNAVGVVSGTHLLAIGFLDSQGALVDLKAEDAVGPFFLHSAAAALLASQYDPSRTSGQCSFEAPADTYRDVTSVISDFLTLQERTPETDEVDPSVVDEVLAGSPSFTDPVTGLDVVTSPNNIVRQLESGVAPSDVTPQAAVPIMILLPHSGDSEQVAVFFDRETQAILGFVQVDPNLAAGRHVVDDRPATVVEIDAPAEGSDVLVYIRSIDGEFTCPPSAGEREFAALESTAFGPDFRAILDLTAGTTALVSEFPLRFDDVPLPLSEP